MVGKYNEPILILGTGALACLFAARLAAAGNRVRMLGTWPEGLAALANLGVTLANEDGSLRSYPVKVSADPNDFSGVRHVLVLVKSWQTARAADQLFKCLAVDGVALTLQNGLGNREKLVEKLGTERVAFGITTGGATLLGPGQVRAGGEGKITVRTRDEGDAVLVSISDTGRGIRPEDRSRIFSPGFTTKAVGVGTGLGLSICKKIVEETHHGSLTFESEPGIGTTFLVRIPVRQRKG